MRLAYILGTYPQPSETFIAREIAGMQARGHAVDIFSLYAPSHGPVADVHYGWATAHARLHQRVAPAHASVQLARRWQRLLAAGGYDLVVAHFGSRPSSIALQAAGDLPLVISLHARDIYVEAECLEEKLTRAWAVATCTQANVDYLREQFPSCAEKIHLIYHGLPRPWLEASILDRPRSEGEALRILAVGRLVAKKGFAVLLDACARLHREGHRFHLRIVGDGPLSDALQQQCERLGLRETVALVGWAGDDGVREAYHWADLLCCPSVIANDGDRDGLPNVLVEAMATGLPVIGSRLSGIPEAVEDGRSGLLVPAGDADALAQAIIRLRDPAQRTVMGTNAAHLVHRRFDGERWLDAFSALLADAARAGC